MSESSDFSISFQKVFRQLMIHFSLSLVLSWNSGMMGILNILSSTVLGILDGFSIQFLLCKHSLYLLKAKSSAPDYQTVRERDEAVNKRIR